MVFYSKKLRDTDTCYSAFDKELLGAFRSVKHFRRLLEGAQFRLHLNHKPVVQALTKKTEGWSGRQQHQLAYLSEFNVEAIYVAGHDNIMADALSRALVAALPLATLPFAGVPSRAQFVEA